MVKRYSHRAVITAEFGNWYKGEWFPGAKHKCCIMGQFFPSNSGMVKVNADGDEKPVHGEFHTRERAQPKAQHICIDAIALDVDIICWEQFQTHSVIYV